MRKEAVLFWRTCAVVGVVGGVAGAWGAWWLHHEQGEQALRQRLRRALWEQVQRGPGTAVDLSQLTPFDWDRVYLFGPYTPSEKIHECVGFTWSQLGSFVPGYSEGWCLAVFVKDGRGVVHWFEHPR